MIKYVALLFNTIALLIYQFFFADGISITQKVPANAKAGTEFTVELTVKKGDADGFAKLQQELPEGFTAEEIATNGASFTFSNQSVKFIWMALPNDKEFKLSYKVKVDPKMEAGDKTIAGRFAYVVNNVKQQVDISPAIIKIGGASSAPVVTNEPPPTPTNTVVATPEDDLTISGYYYDDKGAPIANLKVNLVNKKGEIIRTTFTDKEGYFAFTKLPRDTDSVVALEADDTHIVGKNSMAKYTDGKGNVLETKQLTGNVSAVVTSTEPTPTPTNTATNDGPFNLTNSVAESNGLICVRKTPQSLLGDSYIVEIDINKANLTGFAKYVETLPAGLTATPVDKQDASFSFTDQKLKFVWVSLPTATSFKISYKVTVAPGTIGDHKIDGSFSYIENDETKKYSLPVSIVPVGGEVAKTEPVATQPEPTATQPEPTPVATNTQPEPTPAPEPVKQLSASTIPSPQGEVNYSVQIAALHNAKEPEVVASYYKITEQVKTEMADGFTKYTVGAHKVYKEAHDARDMIKTKGVSDAWVTAYNKGKRITVQEALMITSQKWYK